MKTNVILKAVVMVAVVMASVMNFSASAGNPANFVQNDEMNGNLVTAKTIFRNEEGYLFRHLRYTFTYDGENRVTSKTASRWDSSSETWIPYFKLNVEYNTNEVVVNYARWNSESKAFDRKMEKSVYTMNEDNTVLFASVK